MKDWIRVLAITGAMAFNWPQAQAQIAPSYPADFQPDRADIAYADISERQKLDLFLPEGEGPFPVVLNLHGGAFRFGGKEMLAVPLARAFLDAGIAVASMNYRLSQEAIFPAAVQDAKAAIRYLRANARELKLNPDQIVIFGQSAGAHIATIAATSKDVVLFDDPTLGNNGISARVSAVIDWYGPTDFSQMDAQAKAQGCPAQSQTHSAADSPESQYLGAQITLLPDLVKQANPISYISDDDPPFLIQKGDRDCIVPVAQSKLLYQALEWMGVKAQLDIIEGAGHGDMGSDSPKFLSAENIQRVRDFVLQALTK